MEKLNRNVFLKMRNQKGSTDLRRKKYDIEHRTIKIWETLAEVVINFVDENAFNLKKKLL